MGSTITLTAEDGHKLSAYTAGPSDAQRGLVVIQEIFGVNSHIRNVCDRFAAAGYSVIAPALFDRAGPGIELGYGPDDITKGREARGKTNEAGIMADVKAARKALKAPHAGIVGYCLGGSVAWWAATQTNLFEAAVGWYGGNIAATKDAHPNAPVQLHFGETDASIQLTDVEAIRKAQPGVEVFVYAGAGHGFGCDERGSYSPDAYATAQQRTLDFFNSHLK
jgi:carboxymethylenebutenolidase